MLTYGFEGAIRIASAASSASSTPGAGARVALEANAVDLVAVAAGDEPLLEREAPGRRVDPRAKPVVGRRQDRGLDPERAREPGGDGGERLARAERLRPDEMEAEIAVAEPEPVLAAERARRSRAPPRSRRRGPSRAPRRGGRRARRGCCRGRARPTVRAPRGRRRRCRRSSRRRRRPRRRGRARSARRRRRPRGARPSRLRACGRSRPASAGRRAGRSGAGRRACRRRRRGSGSRTRSPATPIAVGVVAEAGGAAAAVERREVRACRERERVRRPVRRPRRSRSRRARPRRQACAGRAARRTGGRR